MKAVYARIYAMIQRIPRGKVATYGSIARFAKVPNPRQVGFALRTVPSDVSMPWHRVVNAQGRISARSDFESDEIQRVLLEAEGIGFKSDGQSVDLARHLWAGPKP